ncbi:methyl-accepting chemotaxis protein [Cohnella faecalis]|nr:methyl-accepting chemotaxis protein [Cohnella faecalis]
MFKITSRSHTEIAAQLQRFADGDFTAVASPVAAKRKNDSLLFTLRRSSNSLRTLLRLVFRSSRELGDRLDSVTQRSEIISGQAATVTNTIQEVTLGVQEAAENVQRMSEEIAVIHGNLQELQLHSDDISASSSTYRSTVEQGLEAMGRLTGTLETMVGDSEEMTAEMREFREAFVMIANMSKLIDDIASQTQLLALNANIEAARAGDHGTGFAVVAQEVSKLALQTRESAVRITEQMTAATRRSGRLEEAVERMKASVLESSSAMEETTERFKGFAKFIADTDGQLQRMNGNLRAVTDSTSSLSEAVMSTSAMVEQMAAGTEEALASVDVQQHNILSMNESVRQAVSTGMSLRSAVSQFKLPAENGMTPLSSAIESWMEGALGVRAIMLSMIECRAPEDIRAWNERKLAMEQQLEQRFEELAVHCADSRDSRCLAELREAWESFHRTKDRNAGYMLNGEYEKARQGLTQQGRQLFKAALDHAIQWMEDEPIAV